MTRTGELTSMSSVYSQNWTMSPGVMDAFKELVQHDPDVCSNCFRKTHDTYERNYFVTTHHGELWAKQVDGRPARSYPRERNTEYMAAEQTTRGTFRACKCGVPHGTMRPVSLDTLMEYAKRLVTRFQEKDVDFDENVFLDEVRASGESPDMQGKQDRIFAEAISEARHD